MVFNLQVFQYVILHLFLQRIRTNFSQVWNIVKDSKFFWLGRSVVTSIFWGCFSWQIVFAQGLNPTPALSMQGLALNGGGGAITVNNLKTELPVKLESNDTKEKQKNDSAERLKSIEPSALQNVFQKYLLQTTEKTFPIYGQNLFQLSNSYAEIEATNIPIDYLLGPGDELLVKIYSSAIDLDQRFVINRDGMIVLPKLGPLSLAGVRVGDIENRLKKELSQILTDFNLYVSMGQLRGIEIYLTGQARFPGKHNLSSVSTLISALFATGGPTSNGSMREVQLIRGGNQVASIDLYDFIQKGNKGIDVRLLPGDVIHIPPIGPQVAVKGTIPTQAIFELPRNKTSSIGDALSLAGGLTAFTSPYSASLERVNKKLEYALELQNIQLDEAGLKTILRDGDILQLNFIKPTYANVVSLRLLDSPAERILLPHQNARLTDIIPNKEFLLNAEYFYRRFNLRLDEVTKADQLDNLARIKNNALLDQINFENATIERIEAGTLKAQLISFNLGRAIADPQSSDNIQLFSGDIITISNQKNLLVPLDRQLRVIRIQGEVNAPGIYQTNGGETLRDLVKKSGGFTANAYLFGTELTRQSIKLSQKKNIEVVIKRLEDQELLESRQQNLDPSIQSLRLSNQLRLKEKINFLRNSIPSGRLSLELDPKRTQLPDVALENGDEILIPSTPSSIFIMGALSMDSSLMYRPGKTVAEYLSSVGLNSNADRDAIFVVRADGTIQSTDPDKGFFKSNLNKEALNPGDTIVVPEKPVRESGYQIFMRGLKDWTQTLFQLGLGVAAIKVLK